MFYPENNIDELMPDILVQENEGALKESYKFSMNYFLKSRTKKSHTTEFSSTLISPDGDNTLITRTTLEIHEGGSGTLPDCVTCHPIVEYSYRYGVIELSGLDNSIDSSSVNNGSWRP